MNPLESDQHPSQHRVHLNPFARSGKQPDPVQWKQRPSVKSRLFRAVSVPLLAASVIFVVALTIAIAIVWAQPHVPTLNVSMETPKQLSASPDDADLTTGSEIQEKNVFVHVVGEVTQPGVVQVTADSRVADVIEQAGGVTDQADLSSVNLARQIQDGEQILVRSLTEATQQQDAQQGESSSPQLISLNTANQQQLEALPRVGPALAARIIQWREEQGGFTELEQLLQVEGIGNKTFEQLRPLISL